MSTTADLVLALKQELKAADMTYADLAQALGMAESSVKRMLSKGNMSLSHVDAVCRAIKIDFSELARRVADDRRDRQSADRRMRSRYGVVARRRRYRRPPRAVRRPRCRRGKSRQLQRG